MHAIYAYIDPQNHPNVGIWVWPETLVWIVPRCSESDPNPMDQSADPSPMDQTDKSLDPSPRYKHICMVALHPTTFSPVHCEGGGFHDQSHPVCGKPVLKYWPPLNSLGSTVLILSHDEGDARSNHWLMASANSVWPSTILSSGTVFNMV